MKRRQNSGAPCREVGATVVQLQPENECDRGSEEHYRVVPPRSVLRLSATLAEVSASERKATPRAASPFSSFRVYQDPTPVRGSLYERDSSAMRCHRPRQGHIGGGNSDSGGRPGRS